MAAKMATQRDKSSKVADKAPAKAKAAPRARRATGSAPSEKASYHHGDLHGALLKAARRVAERDGMQGLTLRAVAREAGVSHAAPAHHFGDVTGLISELAAIGFKKFSEEMGAAAAAANSPDSAAEGRAKAYVAFARNNPCLFQLMFRAERLDHSRPALREAAERAFLSLAKTVSDRRHEEVSREHLTLAQAADIARIWSMVHGFAMLYLDGRLRDIMAGLPPGTTEEMLLAAMLVPDASGR